MLRLVPIVASVCICASCQEAHYGAGAQNHEPPSKKLVFSCKSGVRFVFIPAQKFVMGTGDELQLLRTVTLSSYWISETEVTFGQVKSALGRENTSASALSDHPVTNNDFTQIMEMVDALGRLDGLPVRLPTEAEWECAARGGLKSAEFPWASTKSSKALANIDADRTCAVASYPPNPFGLFDVVGNVDEVVSDAYYVYKSGDSLTNPRYPDIDPWKLTRGGGYSLIYCPVSERSPQPPGREHWWDVGFRLAVDDSKMMRDSASWEEFTSDPPETDHS